MKANNTYLFEVPVPSVAVGNKFNFPNNLGELNNVLLKGIEVYSADQLVKGPLTYATVVSAAGQKSAVMVVVDGVTDRIKEIPLVDLIPQLNGGLQREFEPFVAVLNKSYIKLVSTSNVNANECFLVNWIYDTIKK